MNWGDTFTFEDWSLVAKPGPGWFVSSKRASGKRLWEILEESYGWGCWQDVVTYDDPQPLLPPVDKLPPGDKALRAAWKLMSDLAENDREDIRLIGIYLGYDIGVKCWWRDTDGRQPCHITAGYWPKDTPVSDPQQLHDAAINLRAINVWLDGLEAYSKETQGEVSNLNEQAG